MTDYVPMPPADVLHNHADKLFREAFKVEDETGFHGCAQHLAHMASTIEQAAEYAEMPRGDYWAASLYHHEPNTSQRPVDWLRRVTYVLGIASVIILAITLLWL